MISEQQRKGLGASLCCCCCCALIFGIVGIVYYEKSFLNVKHECEIYYTYTTLCQYACGTICHRRLLNGSDVDLSSSSSSHSHCYTRYCWGYRYVYDWKTIDWMNHPYKVNDDEQYNMHAYIQSPFNNQTETTTNNLKLLLDYINDETNDMNTLLSVEQIKQTDLTKYVTYMTTDHDIANFFGWNGTTTMTPILTSDIPNTTANPYDVGWCDWKRPAFSDYGSCSSFPFQWYSLGDTETCWTNNKCSYFSTLSPYTNWDLAKGFGFSSVACVAIFVLILLYCFMCWCYAKLCGYSEYDRIDDYGRTLSVDEYTTTRSKQPETFTVNNDDMVINNAPIIVNPVAINQAPMQMYPNLGMRNEEIIVNNQGFVEEIIAPTAPMMMDNEMIIDNRFGNQEVIVNEQRQRYPNFGNEEIIVNNQGFGIGNQEIIVDNQRFGNEEIIVDNQMFGNEEIIVDNNRGFGIGNEEIIVDNQGFGNEEIIVDNQGFGNEEIIIDNNQGFGIGNDAELFRETEGGGYY